MQIQVVGTGKNNIGITKASYSGSCTIAELDNFTGIRKASVELLAQMGVNLTADAKSELSGAARENAVNAQTALARGIVAQRSGNTVETMAQFYAAADYDPSFAEAAARANTLSATIRTGSMGENIRNDIAWRNEWVKILDDAKKYMRKQMPVLATVVYSPNIRQGSVNYKENTVELFFSYEVKGASIPPAYIKLVNDLNAGLKATGRSDIWELKPLKVEDHLGAVGTLDTDRRRGKYSFVRINAELVNSFGKTFNIYSNGRVICALELKQPQYRTEPIEKPELGWNFSDEWRGTSFPSDVVSSRGYIRFVVHADDITDQMTIRCAAYISGFTERLYRLVGLGEKGDIMPSYVGSYPIPVMTEAEYQALPQSKR
jgi:hypothetical protein